MSYLELAEAVKTEREVAATQAESRGANVVPVATLTQQDLKYSIEYVEAELPTLPSKYQRRVSYWADLIMSVGYSQEDALRAAFRRTIRLPRRGKP